MMEEDLEVGKWYRHKFADSRAMLSHFVNEPESKLIGAFKPSKPFVFLEIRKTNVGEMYRHIQVMQDDLVGWSTILTIELKDLWPCTSEEDF